LRTVGENVARVGTPAALTGPIVRGDAATVRAHRDALDAVDPDARAAYDALAPHVLACALAAGLDRARADEVERAFAAALEEGPRRGRSGAAGAKASARAAQRRRAPGEAW
jgi:predicted short-subunit dehydrogenase-like oxidoreductase (DUF2520 family)